MQRHSQKLKPIINVQIFFPRNEDGFLLVLTMFVLVVLTLIGISATNLSRIEMQIAGNDRVHKETFYQADGGTEVGANLLEENISCPVGFAGPAPLLISRVEITADLLPGAKLNFWTNEIDPFLHVPPIPYPSDSQRHIRFLADNTVPVAGDNTKPHTNLHFFGNSGLSTGNAIQMIAGYEGTGYSAATGGGQLVTNVDSQHMGVMNSLSNIRILWKHIIGFEGTCKY
jgi:hypothetical protein